MHASTDQLSEGSFGKCTEYLKSIVSEYCQLSVLRALTEEQVNRLSIILDQAESDSLLSFLITEIDHITGHELDLIDDAVIQKNHDIDLNTYDLTWKASSTKAYDEFSEVLLMRNVRSTGLLEAAEMEVAENVLRKVRHSRRSRWLDECERLKGECPTESDWQSINESMVQPCPFNYTPLRKLLKSCLMAANVILCSYATAVQAQEKVKELVETLAGALVIYDNVT